RGEHHYQERVQPVSWQPVRIRSQPRLQRRELLQLCERRQDGGPAEAEPVWRHYRRTGQDPHLFNGDKSFFFVGYQKTINHTAAVSATAATLPTAAQLAGTFANEKACLSD